MRKMFLVFLIAACGQRSEHRQARAAAATPPPPAQSAPASPIAITTPAGEAVVEIAQQGSDLAVTFTDGGTRQVIHGRVSDKGKRKYSAGNGGVVLEVKPAEDGGGFKVRTADGKLLWKIKRSEDKVKISDNEENRNPFELKIKEEKVKVYAPPEQLLGEVKFYSDMQRVEVKDAAGRELFRASGSRAEPFYGVPLLEKIPARERAVIIAELAAPLRR
jgi:hypothetical protein